MPESSLNNSSQDALRHKTHFTGFKSTLLWFLLPLLGAAAFRYYYFKFGFFFSVEPKTATNVMASVSLRALTVAARSKHTATIIFVHGLGDSGAGWEFVAKQLGAEKELHHVKWVLPHAPIQSVTANMGASMPSWYDIYQFAFSENGGKRKEDEEGMLKSSRQLNELITAEIDAGISASRIVLGGFSQGGVMSLLTGLTNERKLGGIVALSCYIPLKDKFKAMVSDHARKLPIFWGHGKADPLVVYEACQQSIAYLKKDVGIADAKDGETTGVWFRGYEGVPHSVCEEEVEDLGTWLKNVLPQN